MDPGAINRGKEKADCNQLLPAAIRRFAKLNRRIYSGDGEGDGEVRLSPAAGPPLASAPLAPEPFFELLVLDFFVELFFEVPLPASVPLVELFVEVCVLLPEVVVAVSVVFVHEATNATPTRATMHERRDFFIGVGLSERACRNSAAHA